MFRRRPLTPDERTRLIVATTQDLTDAVTQLVAEVESVGTAIGELITVVKAANISPEDQAAIDTAVANVQTATSALTADVTEADTVIPAAPAAPAEAAPAEAPAAS
jgi:predicted trehalose synthase